jgi:hypothetical protein
MRIYILAAVAAAGIGLGGTFGASTRVRFAKSAKHSASIGPNFPDRRAASVATSVGGLFHYFENAGAMSALGPKRAFELSSIATAYGS